VLRIATWNGARLAGLAGETGSIATDKRADMILVDGDPTQRIGDIRRISLVLKEGVMMFPPRSTSRSVSGASSTRRRCSASR